MKAMLLLSGGVDSAAVAYWLRPEYALTVDYGQRASAREIESAAYIADFLGIQHQILKTDLASLGAGVMAGETGRADAPSPEWWPFRNQYLLTLAAMAALRVGLSKVLIGTVSTDYTHRDGRSSFFQSLNALLDTQEGDVQVVTPALGLTAPELVVRSKIPISLLAGTHSCHVSNIACGRCRGCNKHAEAFAARCLV